MNILGEDTETDINFSINENYAKRYDKWRQGEELQKLRDKYGDDVNKKFLSSEDEDEEEEDENAEELTRDIEKDFFKTLSYLKGKNPIIYDQNFKFFKNNSAEGSPKREKRKKADCFYSVGEYQRNILIEKKGQFSDDEEKEKSFKELSNFEQEKAIRESFKDIMKDSESENENEDWGGLFKKRIKTDKELRNEEEDYKLWLAGEREKLKNMDDEKDMKSLHDYWTDPTLDEGECFLRDYILNKRFLEKDENGRIPAYDEIVHDSDSGLSADENTLEQQEEFERKYNFRFEEPDQDFIKRYPRTLEHSMRKKDDKRKKHREEVKARKEAEKEKKLEELKRLKALKRKEIIEKIKKLQDITGNEDMAFQKNDLEEDFDPEKHDKRMSELFNEDYYGICEDKTKPEYPELDEDLEIENWDEWTPDNNEGEEEELHCEDPGFNMDCDYNPPKKNNLEKELMESSKKRKKRRQSKFAAAIAKEKPVFDPKNKSFEKYLDEYYSLDYEDLIGDLPCRFKYRKVVPNDFGLSVEEILAAPDKELNSWVSLKKIMKRRPENVEWYDVKAYKKKAKDFNNKRKCLPSLYESKKEDPEDDKELDSAKKKIDDKKVKPRNKNKLKTNDKDVNATNSKLKKFKNGCNDLLQMSKRINKNNFDLKNTNLSKKNHSKVQPSFEYRFDGVWKKEKRLKSLGSKVDEQNKNSVDDIPDKRLKLYGINPKKLKNKLKYGKKVSEKLMFMS